MPVDPNAGVDVGWDGEIALDISSAHAIAPGAKILEVNAAGQDDDDFASAMSYIVDHTLGYTVSDSWEEDYEYISGTVESKTFDSILQLAAAKGISFQFSTGDYGDGGIGSPVGAAEIPSNAPHGTAVGGTTLLNTPAGYRNVPWGDVFTYLYYGELRIPRMEASAVGRAVASASTSSSHPGNQASRFRGGAFLTSPRLPIRRLAYRSS